MPHPCVVCGRSRMNPNNRAEEYTFFGFPVNDEYRCKKWLEFCCREELYKLTKKQLLQRMICSKHFLLSDFMNELYDRLKNTAIPSVYDPKQSLYNISCVLCGRFRKNPPGPENDDATFHHFPGEEFRCLDWLDFVGVDSYYRLTRKEIMFCYICSKHFHKSQFVPGYHNRLIDSAIPSVKCEDESIQLEELDPPSTDYTVELFNSNETSSKTIDPLPVVVLESQACAACGRLRSDPKNKSQKYKFHPFPAYEIGRCLKWCQFLEREDILKMSPNQIRKLVLCSKHFQAGQNFNNGAGPCDAIPTIKDCNNDIEIVSNTIEVKSEGEGNKILRASVSSKKPKMDPSNRPAPLAKKRGRAKRPTTINIPKIETKVDNYIVKKLPIPTVHNWKLIANQFQPITVTNNIVSNISPNTKKVILPFAGDITNLGTPIPVKSLSSIPPGLLIKINLPEQKKNCVKPVKKKIRRKFTKQLQNIPIQANETQATIKSEALQEDIEYNSGDNITHFLSYTAEDSKQIIYDESELQEEREIPNEECAQKNIEDKDENMCHKASIEKSSIQEVQPKFKMTTRCRRTLIPIQYELRHFLNKLKPYVKRLPKKSKAQVKLAIINKVIEWL